VTVAAGPFTIASALLALGGALKALRPADTANALRGIGLPAPRVAVVLGGLAEALLGVAALVLGNRVTAVLVALSYLAFAAFVVEALRRNAPIASCGCFGRIDTPPSTVHVAVNLAAAGAAVAVAAQPGVGLADILGSQPLAGVPFLVLVAIGLSLSFLALSTLPRTLAAIRPPEARR
jgi:hypothetical protein